MAILRRGLWERATLILLLLLILLLILKQYASLEDPPIRTLVTCVCDLKEMVVNLKTIFSQLFTIYYNAYIEEDFYSILVKIVEKC